MILHTKCRARDCRVKYFARLQFREARAASQLAAIEPIEVMNKQRRVD